MVYSFVIIDTKEKVNSYSLGIVKIFAEYHKWRWNTLFNYKPEKFKKIFEESDTNIDRIIQSYESAITTGIPYENFYSYFENKLNNYYKLHLLEKNDEFIGHASIESFSDRIVILHRMYVKPSHRGRNLGRVILDKIVQTAKVDGFSKLYLATIPILKSAIKLYEDFGFIYRDYYQTPDRSEEQAKTIHSIFMEYSI
jgi:GNAT superfamily N-acetyltransferase